MINKNIFLRTLLISLLAIKSFSYSQGKTIVISGIIKGLTGTIKPVIVFNENYIIGQGEKENIFIHIPVNNKGQFFVSLPAIDHIGRITMYDATTHNNFFTMQIVEPGDSVHLEIVIEDDTYNVTFSGKGAAKFNCVQRLTHLIDYGALFQEMDPYRVAVLRDSLLIEKWRIMEPFKQEISHKSYQLIKADIVGDLNDRIVHYSPIFSNAYESKTLSNEERKMKLRDLKLVFDKDIKIAQDIQFLSSGYISFLCDIIKLQLILENGKRNILLKDVYTNIKLRYKGVLREKLLAYCLLNDLDRATFYKTVNEDEYTNCLKDATCVIKTAWLNTAVKYVLKSRGKGAAAFNFTLPADSSNRKVRLTDFKGKVVLLDIWAYSCTGCYLFANVFHKNVYPIFKNDPNFVVISVMADPSSKDAYMRRLRGIGGITMTYPEYVNLFAGKGEDMGRELAEHYNINSWPCILLIDRNGKIYSSTIPFFTDESSTNVRELTNLIKKALAS